MSDVGEPVVKFFSIEEIKEDVSALDNYETAASPEWFVDALKAAWQEGFGAGNVDGYYGSREARNPFMTAAELKAWYGA